MGNSESVSFRSKPVVFPSSHYIPTINKRFVKDRVTTLELHDQFWTQPSDYDYIIRDVATNQTVFKIGPISDEDSTAPHRRRLLLDAYGVPVVGMERHERPPRSAQYTVIPGGAASKTHMCTFTTQMLGPHEPRLLLEFTDPVSGKPMILDARGYWQSRDAVITITDDPRRNGSVYCIARIYCDGSPLDGVYKMDVAAGVDLSFVLLLAAALEEQTKKHMTAPDRMALRNAVKAAEQRTLTTPAAAAVPQKQKLVGTVKPGAVAARAV